MTVMWADVQAAQAGDADAFARIYREHRDGVHAFAARRVRPAWVAEDITAQTFTNAWARIGTVNDTGRDIGAWLTTIARNLVIDYIKSAAVRHRAVGEPPEGIDEAADPCDLAVLADDSRRVREAMRQLTDPQRDVIKARFLDDLTVDESAAALGINTGAVKSLQYRAVLALRRVLADEIGVAA